MAVSRRTIATDETAPLDTLNDGFTVGVGEAVVTREFTMSEGADGIDVNATVAGAIRITGAGAIAKGVALAEAALLLDAFVALAALVVSDASLQLIDLAVAHSAARAVTTREADGTITADAAPGVVQRAATAGVAISNEANLGITKGRRWGDNDDVAGLVAEGTGLAGRRVDAAEFTPVDRVSETKVAGLAAIV